MKPKAKASLRQSEKTQVVRLCFGRQSGQIVVEYVLLLIVAIALAALITKGFVSRDPGSPGFLITSWNSLITQIGADHADGTGP